MLGNVGRRLADALRDLFAAQPARQFAPDVVGDLARGQVVALEVFDDLVGLVVIVVDKGGNGEQIGRASCRERVF